MSVSELINSVKSTIAVILVLLLLPVSSLETKVTHEAKNGEELVASFTVLSDCHVETNNYDSYSLFKTILLDAKATETKDAAIFLGDNTMNGQFAENALFFGALKAVRPADETLVVMGNHDVGNGEGDYEKMSKQFLSYNKTFLGESHEKPYFYKVIKGCYLICLATEESTVNTMKMTDGQYNWLKAVLDEADEKDAPIFVFNHYPVNYMEGDYEYLSDLLNDYESLVYFSGHNHFALTEYSFSVTNGVRGINLPRCTETVTQGHDCGIGAVVEVYEDEVLVRIRNFVTGQWLPEFERSYSI